MHPLLQKVASNTYYGMPYKAQKIPVSAVACLRQTKVILAATLIVYTILSCTGKPAVQSAGVAPADPSNDASKEEAVSSPATMVKGVLLYLYMYIVIALYDCRKATLANGSIEQAGSTHQADKDNVSGQQQPIRPDNGLSDSMDIVFISAEVAPWSKTGGLGDVVGSLPIALARRGHRVMVVAPR